MARPKKEIHVERGKRLKQLCDEQGISQQELSRRTNISQQNISCMVNGKANVTENTANIIVKEFPEYSFEWLMGYSDFKTSDEMRVYARDLADRVLMRNEHFIQCIISMAEMRGYHIERNSGQTEYIRDNIIYLDSAQMDRLAKEMMDFLELRLKWLCENELPTLSKLHQAIESLYEMLY